MLIFCTTTVMTQKASEWLTAQGVENRVIPVPESLGYKTGSDTALYVASSDNMDIPMRLSKERFIVMRVFREFVLEDS